MHGVGVGGRMHRDGRDAELLAGAQHPQRDLAAVGDQDFFEHRLPLPPLDDHQRLAEFDRLAVLEQDLGHGAGARRRNLVHRLHRLDDQQRVARLHLAADVDERLARRARADDRRCRPSARSTTPGCLRRIDGAAVDRDRRGDAVAPARSAPRPRRAPTCARLARDAHAQAVALDLDLGEAGFVEQLRQLADQVVFDRRRLRHRPARRTYAPRQSFALGCRHHRGKAGDGKRVALDAETADDALRAARDT